MVATVYPMVVVPRFGHGLSAICGTAQVDSELRAWQEIARTRMYFVITALLRVLVDVIVHRASFPYRWLRRPARPSPSAGLRY